MILRNNAKRSRKRQGKGIADLQTQNAKLIVKKLNIL